VTWKCLGQYIVDRLDRDSKVDAIAAAFVMSLFHAASMALCAGGVCSKIDHDPVTSCVVMHNVEFNPLIHTWAYVAPAGGPS
jgi:hypothetical protein